MRCRDVTDTRDVLRLEWLSLVTVAGFRRSRMFDLAAIRRLETGNKGTELICEQVLQLRT
jgi:hypothetical protein